MSTPAPEPQPAAIAVAVVQRADEFLIGRRPEGVAQGGLWEFPGGKVARGETPQQTAVRECLEETGLAVVVEGTYPAVQHAYDDCHLRLHFFACRALNPAQAPLSPFRWVSRAELGGFEFPAANRELITRLITARDSC